MDYNKSLRKKKETSYRILGYIYIQQKITFA